ncbi:hypothetical protein MAP_3391c [Mycobacterium avium subsp. paratuberculosis K-10]|uniref:Response regulatory domain-containing protein n=1 Tax=Mycolicibacterium paratuberculosis (strain ATCC BAA-968 / K-10) TaxID=262316 RepID=Q73UH7_MYCPA|nr:hypothetical protein MAP_3391c [Mycobacterium avium subsp. paratuberculosis K-10]
MIPAQAAVTPAAQRQSLKPLSVLLVEDDRGDAVLVEELVTDAVTDIRVVWAQSMAHAERELESTRPDCVLLDLHLPDPSGIDALNRIAKLDATVPIVVLTGLNDEYFGASAVAAGAQDYLVKGRVEPEMLRRALLYAIERKRAELIAADLHATQLRARENALLERGLLPSPLLLDDPGVDIVARYRPSREDALLCGDFYDVVQTPDRVVHVLIGDVAGHGPHEAALGGGAADRVPSTHPGRRARRRTDAPAGAGAALRTHRHRDLRDRAQPGDLAAAARGQRHPRRPSGDAAAGRRHRGMGRTAGRAGARAARRRLAAPPAAAARGARPAVAHRRALRGVFGAGDPTARRGRPARPGPLAGRSLRPGVRRRPDRRRPATGPAARRPHR